MTSENEDNKKPTLAAVLRAVARAMDENPDADWDSAHARLFLQHGLADAGLETDGHNEVSPAAQEAMQAIFAYAPLPRRREYPLGFQSDSPLEPGETRTLEERMAQPDTWYFPNRLVTPSDSNEDFMLEDVLIGRASQFAAPGGMPANVFGENRATLRLKLDPLRQGEVAALRVRNDGTEPVVFRAVMIGRIVSDEEFADAVPAATRRLVAVDKLMHDTIAAHGIARAQLRTATEDAAAIAGKGAPSDGLDLP